MISVHIEFISDFICPWCYIGKARLERLMDILKPEINLDIESKPYILYPHIPPGGLPKSDFAGKTKTGMGRSLRYESQLEGIQLNYKYIERIPFSRDAHKLISIIDDHALQFRLAKSIFYAYFEEGQDIEDEEFLVMVGKKLGVPVKQLDKFTNSDAGELAVKVYLKQIQEEFISVVPSLRIDQKIVLPGLQSLDVWESYIRRAAELQSQN